MKQEVKENIIIGIILVVLFLGLLGMAVFRLNNGLT